MDSSTAYSKSLTVVISLATIIAAWYWAGSNYARDVQECSAVGEVPSHIKIEFYAIWLTAGALCSVMMVAFAIAMNDGSRVVSRFIIGKFNRSLADRFSQTER